MNSNQIRLAYSFAVLNAVIIGFSFLFTKSSLAYAHPLDLLTFRFAISFGVMSVPVALGWIKLRYRGKPVHKVLLLAAMYPLGFFTLQAFGLQLATSAEAGILYAFTPAVTMLLASVFLRETTSLFQKLSIFLSVFGVVFMFVMNGSRMDWSNVRGILLLCLTCLAFAGYSVLTRSLAQQFTPAEISYLTLGAGLAVFLTVSLTRHTAAGTLGHFLTPLASGKFLAMLLYLGVGASLVTSLLTGFILSRIEASKMGVFSNLATVVSIAAGASFAGESVTVYHIIGSVLIIAGVMGANRAVRKPVVILKKT